MDINKNYVIVLNYNIMRKIGCISQTYGDSRLLEINCIAYDRVGTALRNSLDEISFTFHNSPQKFKEKAKTILSNIYEKPVVFREYDEISYYDSILAQLNEMKVTGFTDILLIQDDQYGLNNNNNIEKVKNIVDFYRANLDVTFLHIFGREGYPSKHRLPLCERSHGDIIFNKFDSRDFKRDGIWSYNDGTYLASIDFLLTLLRPNAKVQIPSNVWHFEMYCKMILDNKKSSPTNTITTTNWLNTTSAGGPTLRKFSTSNSFTSKLSPS